eukprot:PLAT9823.1.p1 GENE.PLAT9823.1~~PLAT9823.1.p1  ORF type:complete len:499 (+),score=-13.25 PLAT9823.1:187-1683(+)
MGQALARALVTVTLTTVVNAACVWKTVTDKRGRPIYSGCVDSGLSIRSRTLLVPVTGRGRHRQPWPKYTNEHLCSGGAGLDSKRTDSLPLMQPEHARGHLIADCMVRAPRKEQTYYLMNMWCEPAVFNSGLHSLIEENTKDVRKDGVFWIGVAALAENDSGTLVDITSNLTDSKNHKMAGSVSPLPELDCDKPNDSAGFLEEDGDAACSADRMETLHHPAQRAYAWWMVLYYPQIDQSLCLVAFPYDGYTVADCDSLKDVKTQQPGDPTGFVTGVRETVYNAAVEALKNALLSDATLSFAYGAQRSALKRVGADGTPRVRSLLTTRKRDSHGELKWSSEKGQLLDAEIFSTVKKSSNLKAPVRWRNHACGMSEEDVCEWEEYFKKACGEFDACKGRWNEHELHLAADEGEDEGGVRVVIKIEGSDDFLKDVITIGGEEEGVEETKSGEGGSDAEGESEVEGAAGRSRTAADAFGDAGLLTRSRKRQQLALGPKEAAWG